MHACKQNLRALEPRLRAFYNKYVYLVTLRYKIVSMFSLKIKDVLGTAPGFNVGKLNLGSLIYTMYWLLPFSVIFKFSPIEKPMEPFFG